MKKTLLRNLTTVASALAVAIAFSATAQAVPSLQVYSPSATYDAGTESWVTTATDFEIWIIASKPLYNVQISAALGDGEDPYAGSLDIDGSVYSGADFSYGDHTVLAKHGIFPADHINHAIGDMTTMTANTVTDFNDDYEHGVTPFNTAGMIMKFNVSVTGFASVHFDAWGYDGDQKYWFAPFSHDGGTAVPEPATLLLFGIGAAGAGIARRFRKK